MNSAIETRTGRAAGYPASISRAVLARDTAPAAIAGPEGEPFMASLLRYTASNAPWALVASLSTGLSNYLILLLLSGAYGLAASGQFRLYLSIILILRIFSLTETGKIAVKYLVLGERGVVMPLLLNRMRWSFLGVVAGFVTAAIFYSRGSDLWIPIMIGSALLPLTYPSDIYGQINQARRQFRANAIYSATKNGALVLLAVIAASSTKFAVVPFLVAYSVLLTAFNVYFLTRHAETFEPPSANADTYVREGLHLSGGGLFPVALEHADKFLIGYFFGLEALGIYTIGVSTGQLLVRFVKPLLTIFFPILVNHLPTTKILVGTLVVLTAVGLAGAIPLDFYFTIVLGSTYLAGYPLAVIVLSGLGFHATGVIIQYSSIYHKHSRVVIPNITNITTTLIVVCCLLLAVFHERNIALLLCAASYPLRDLLNIVTTVILSKKVIGYEEVGTVS